jgi:hypothetical protein
MPDHRNRGILYLSQLLALVTGLLFEGHPSSWQCYSIMILCCEHNNMVIPVRLSLSVWSHPIDLLASNSFADDAWSQKPRHTVLITVTCSSNWSFVRGGLFSLFVGCNWSLRQTTTLTLCRARMTLEQKTSYCCVRNIVSLYCNIASNSFADDAWSQKPRHTVLIFPFCMISSYRFTDRLSGYQAWRRLGDLVSTIYAPYCCVRNIVSLYCNIASNSFADDAWSQKPRHTVHFPFLYDLILSIYWPPVRLSSMASIGWPGIHDLCLTGGQ